MNLKRNENMDFIEAEDGSMAVFDPESGDAHILDEIGRDILHLLSKEISFNHLIEKLREIYDDPENEMEIDTKELLDELISKKVVLQL